MNNKQTIAEKHGVIISNFQPRNIIVKDITILNCCGGIVSLLVSLLFMIMPIINNNNTGLRIACISLSVILLLLSILDFIHIFLFKIEFQEKEKIIYYRDFCKKFNFPITDIQYFMVEEDEDMLARFYTIRIYLSNKKIKYTISQTNKENFIFLLNLLKCEVEQI